MKDNIERFNLQICSEKRHYRQFCVVSPSPNVSENVELKIDMFLKYHLAFRPDVPVVLFELEDLHNVGSPLYRYQDIVLYHLPPTVYELLDDSVKETDFIISHKLMVKLIETNKVYTSIFQCLLEVQQNDGLNVLGFLNAT